MHRGVGNVQELLGLWDTGPKLTLMSGDTGVTTALLGEKHVVMGLRPGPLRPWGCFSIS